MAGCGDECGADLKYANRHERRILIVVLLINAGMFIAEFSAGLVSGSTALLADSLDMLAAAFVTWSGSSFPDIVIGLLIAAVVIHSAWRIVTEAKEQLQSR